MAPEKDTGFRQAGSVHVVWSQSSAVAYKRKSGLASRSNDLLLRFAVLTPLLFPCNTHRPRLVKLRLLPTLLLPICCTNYGG